MLEYRDNKTGRLLWIAPSAVHYDMEQVEFLLPRLNEMMVGEYEAEPVESERGSGSHHAPHEAVCIVAAELDCRLAETGKDRYLVEEYYHPTNDTNADEILRRLGRKVHLQPMEVYQTIQNAVSFIASGECRRWTECSECYRFSKCRKRKKSNRNTVPYQEWCRRQNKYYNGKRR
jgi:hypothetical protein